MLRKVLTGYEHSVHTHEMIEQLLLENTQIVPIPLQPIHNELDQWIYAELHRVIMLVDEHLASYAIEHATKVLIGFVDSLTNWYVRRSRRRFWASGMEQDKRSAYQTLWDVLQTYLRLLAPFAPFTSEYLRQAMQMP
jgi:isoleucyl-tRNA synthetase